MENNYMKVLVVEVLSVKNLELVGQTDMWQGENTPPSRTQSKS